jgi:hypothetical protein
VLWFHGARGIVAQVKSERFRGFMAKAGEFPNFKLDHSNTFGLSLGEARDGVQNTYGGRP